MPHLTSKLLLLALLLSLSLIFCLPAQGQPEIAHIFPDFSGSHLQAEAHPHQVVNGDNFGKKVQFFGWTSPDDPAAVDAAIAGADFDSLVPPSKPPAGAKEIPVLSLDNGVAVLPVRDLAVGLTGSHTVIWAVDDRGASKPYLVHVAKPFWVSKDSVVAGDNLYLFGFGVRGKVALRGEGGVFFGEPFREARSPRHDDPNLLYFRVPAETPAGEYAVYAHNGQGGIYGWQKAESVEVRVKKSEPKQVFNVKEFGAIGQGLGSELEALQKAVAAAEAAGGGRVYFPPGTYRVDETLVVPEGVELVGAGGEQSILEGIGFDSTGLKTHFWNPTGEPLSVVVMNNRTRLESMAVRGSVSKGSGGYATITGTQGPTDITIKNCRILGMEGDVEDGKHRYRAALRFGGARHVSILENDITGSLEMRPYSYRSEIINNTFRRGTLMDMCSIMIPGSKNLIDANRFIDTPGRLAVFRGYRNYIRYNEMHAYGRGSWTNVPEPFLFHGGSSQTAGEVVAADEGTLTDNTQEWKENAFEGATVLIYDGRGKGQYRIVKGNNATTLELESPWRVIPDGTSKYSVGQRIVENGIYANQNHSPGVLTLWLDCIGNVVEKHRDNNSMGIYVYGDDRSRVGKDGVVTNPERYHPSWFNLINNNWEDGTGIWLQGTAHPDNAYDGLPLFGNMVTHNKVRHPHQQRSPNTSHKTNVSGIELQGGDGKVGASHTLILGNQVSNTGVGVLVMRETVDTFIIGNRFHDVAQPMVAPQGSLLARNNLREIIGPQGMESWPQKEQPSKGGEVIFEKEETADAVPVVIEEITEVLRPGAGKVGDKNLALGKPVSGSLPSTAGGVPVFTDGNPVSNFGADAGPQYLQVDLGEVYPIGRVRLWHHFQDRRSYRGVIVQLSEDPHFSKNVVTVFNNDTEGLAAQGEGTDPRYYETAAGFTIDFQPVRARFIRTWINGSNANSFNHWGQLEAYEATK